MKKNFSKEFDETNFENSCFSWELSFVTCKINEILPLQNFLFYYLFHILCSKAVAQE